MADGGIDISACTFEATPEVQVELIVEYLNGDKQTRNASLSMIKVMYEILARLAPQLDLDAQRVSMSWSKRLDDGQLQEAVRLSGTRTLLSYGVQTDDVIIWKESETREKHLDSDEND